MYTTATTNYSIICYEFHRLKDRPVSFKLEECDTLRSAVNQVIEFVSEDQENKLICEGRRKEELPPKLIYLREYDFDDYFSLDRLKFILNELYYPGAIPILDIENELSYKTDSGPKLIPEIQEGILRLFIIKNKQGEFLNFSN